jgi:acyl-coenzyme A thioesterase PaaI-like protein
VNRARLVHHELCFGCGRTNLFGLLMDAEATERGVVRGRGFIKQDHQGAVRGVAHEGIVMAALSEAMSLACGPDMRASQIEARIEAPVPVGAFLEVEAEVGEATTGGREARATATVDGQPVATARGLYESR